MIFRKGGWEPQRLMLDILACPQSLPHWTLPPGSLPPAATASKTLQACKPLVGYGNASTAEEAAGVGIGFHYLDLL